MIGTCSSPSPAHLHPFREKTDGAGFVLIMVLWLLALLAVMVIALTNTVRLDVQAKTNLLARAQAEALADGVTFAVAARLMEQLAGAPGPALTPNGVPARCALDGNAVDILVTDVAGLIDLNAAPVELLARVIAGVGVPVERAGELAAAIVDFRDFDDEPLPVGAEAKEYRAAGMPFGPKNAPFETVDELDQVLGMTPAILARLRELVTVHSRSPGLDVQLAPPALVMALAGPEHGTADGIGGARAQLAGQFVTPGGSRSRTQIVTVGVATANGGHFRRRTVVEVSAASALGFAIREWGTASEPGDGAAIDPAPECARNALW